MLVGAYDSTKILNDKKEIESLLYCKKNGITVHNCSLCSYYIKRPGAIN